MKCSITLSVLAAAGVAVAQWGPEHHDGWEHHSKGEWASKSGEWDHSKGWGESTTWTSAAPVTTPWYPAQNSTVWSTATATQAPPMTSSYVPPPATGGAENVQGGLVGAVLAGIAALVL